MQGMSRDEFIEKNMGLVMMVAKRYRGIAENNVAIDFEDLKGLGSIGLLKAYNKFDPAFGTQFSTYAVPMIDGEIKRFLRDHHDSIKFSRQLRVNCNEILKVGLIDEKPIVISKILNMPLEDVESALGYYKHKYIDELDRVIYEDEGTPITLAERIGTEIDFDTNIEIEEFLNKLDDKTKRIVKLRLLDLTQTEISKIIGISQVQVSRILTKAVKQIQGGIKMSKTNEKKADFSLALKLAKETNLSTTEIMAKAGVSYPTAYRYVKANRATKEEIEDAKNRMESKEPPVKTYQLSPEELEKYRLDMPDYNPLDHVNKQECSSIITDINKSIINKTSKPLTTEVNNDWKENKEPVLYERNTHKAEEPIKETKVEIIKAPAKEEIKAPVINADGFLQLDIKASTDDATSKLNEILKAMKILGFNELDITIKSQQVA